MDGQEAKKDVEVANREAIKIAEQVTSVKIRKDADLAEAAEVLAQIKSTAKNIEKKRKAITGPLNASLKEINEMFKVPSSKLAAAEELIKAEMLSYQQKVDARAAKKIGKIQEQVDSGELDMAEGMGKLGAVKQGVSGVNTEAGSTSFRKTRKLKIVDPSQLPVHYYLRERVIEALRIEVETDIKAGVPIPDGAEYIEEVGVAVRTAK